MEEITNLFLNSWYAVARFEFALPVVMKCRSGMSKKLEASLRRYDGATSSHAMKILCINTTPEQIQTTRIFM